MAKRLTDIQIDGIGFNVRYWADKTAEDFAKEANREGAEMVPRDVPESEKAAWLKTAHELIVKANAGDAGVKAKVNTEELKAEAEKAAAKEAKDKTKGKTNGNG